MHNWQRHEIWLNIVFDKRSAGICVLGVDGFVRCKQDTLTKAHQHNECECTYTRSSEHKPVFHTKNIQLSLSQNNKRTMRTNEEHYIDQWQRSSRGRWRGADLMMLSTRIIISAASAPLTNTWRFTWNDSVIPRSSILPTSPLSMSETHWQKQKVWSYGKDLMILQFLCFTPVILLPVDNTRADAENCSSWSSNHMLSYLGSKKHRHNATQTHLLFAHMIPTPVQNYSTVPAPVQNYSTVQTPVQNYISPHTGLELQYSPHTCSELQYRPHTCSDRYNSPHACSELQYSSQPCS